MLDRLWSLIADHPDLLATRAEWKESLDADYPLASIHLVATQEISKTWVCGRPGTSGCYRRVIEHSHDHLVAVCPEGRCDRVPLDRADVVLHRLDLRSLCRELCLALHLNHRKIEVIDDDRVGSSPSLYRLGIFTINGRGIAIYFTRRTLAEQLLPILETMRLRDHSGSAVLLVPVDEGIDMVVRSAARRANVIMLQIHRTVKVDSGHFELNLREILDTRADDEDHGPADIAPSQQQPIFRRSSNQVWEVRFGEGEAFHLRDLLGILCVHHLLSNPGQDIHCLRLREMAGGGPPADVGSAVDLEAASAFAGRVRAKGEPVHVDAISDPQALRQYHKRLKVLENDLEKAKANNDRGSIDRIERERAALRSEVGRATDKRRNPRIADEAEKARKSVSANIHRVFNAIEDENEDLATHLRAFMRPESMMWSYRPDTNLDWVL